MAGFRTFATGEVLTAANVNNFLMKQSVMVFADAAARTTALGAEVAEGMLTYNEDTAQLEVFDGAAFVLAAPAPPAGIGSNVVQTVKTDTFTTTSSSYVDITGLAVTITPSSATSKILLMAAVPTRQNPEGLPALAVIRNSTQIFLGDAAGSRRRATTVTYGGFNVGNATGPLSFVFVDSPATGSAVTYKLQIAVNASVTVNASENDSDALIKSRTASSLIAIEVAA